MTPLDPFPCRDDIALGNLYGFLMSGARWLPGAADPFPVLTDKDNADRGHAPVSGARDLHRVKPVPVAGADCDAGTLSPGRESQRGTIAARHSVA